MKGIKLVILIIIRYSHVRGSPPPFGLLFVYICGVNDISVFRSDILLTGYPAYWTIVTIGQSHYWSEVPETMINLVSCILDTS